MKIIDMEKCCGCRVCVQSCPKQAISVYYDKYGFERIKINDDMCINCNKCKTVCPILNTNKVDGRKSCGSAYCKDPEIKKAGSSGGLFGLVARTIIENNGVVYGAAFDSDLHLKTTRADSIESLKGLYKSKYLLCDTSGAFSKIKSDLLNGIKVMYCSSPCQITALKNYLHIDYENLLCVEFICHGVGGQKQFDDSIKYIEKKNNIKVLKFGFRDKYKKGSSHYYQYYYKDLSSGKIKRVRDIYMTFPYYYAYCDRMTCRESCYHCKFATEERVGDITIGDFHTISKYQPEIDRFAGVSMFVCNTEKGQKMIDSIAGGLIIKKYDWDTIKNNNRFSGDENPPKATKAYMHDYVTLNYQEVVKKHFNYLRDWRYYYYHLPDFIRVIGNKVLRREN